MKNTVKRTTARIITVVMIATMVFFAKGTAINATAVENNTKVIGTVEAVREFIEEALKEKAIAANTQNIEATVEPVVEGATGTTESVIEEAEAEIEEVEEIEVVETEIEEVEEVIEAEIEEVEEATEEIEETTIAEEAEVEIIEDVEEVVEDEIEEVVEEEVEEVAAISEEIVVGEDVENSTVASTADAPATAEEVVTIDGVSEEGYEDAVEVEYTEAETNYTVANTTATYLGTTDGTRSAFTVIGDDTLYYHSQEVIDAGNIICYPNCDMTTGVKYFAGHNPGAMSHMSATNIGSVVRLSNDDTYQDYRIIDHTTSAHGESFGSIYLNGQNVWTMLTRGTQNAVIVQFCINGQNNFWYGVAI